MLERSEFETHDRDEAIAAMIGMVGTSFTVGGHGHLSVKTAVTTSDVVTDASLHVDTEFRALADPADKIHIVTTSGVFVVQARGVQTVAREGQTIRPPTTAECGFIVPRGVFAVTSLPLADVRDVARRMFVDEPALLDLTAIKPVSAHMESLWLSTIGFYRAHILQPEMYANTLIREEATRTLIATAILAFGLHSPADASASPSSAARRARAYIDEHLAEPVTIHDIAAAARLSVRGVQHAFHRAYGTSPMAHLRAARLSAVRRDLLAADPTTDTVAAVARRRGFAHMGRFAGLYRDTYGESPHDTLSN